MIRVLDRQSRATPPAWMVGAADLCSANCRDGIVHGIGHAALLYGDGPWRDLPDGYAWAGSISQEEEPTMRRFPPAYACEEVTDGALRQWMAPRIIDERGERAFPVAYGDDWLPSPTDEQQRALRLAAEALVELRSESGAGIRSCLAIAAEFLCLVYHLTPRIVAGLRMLDDRLMIETLRTAASLEGGEVVRG